ncbi:unnamed protein product [Vitrella brassicaformis CCMP3155]|uniref:TOG domain-containing protein n=4 Tax=Vitrella brassicaformis TaxID=1169539 RepID=A0A0G4GVN2_VITBC|nr:unnamed protein product [Vitrella brassicaformis CCMP3155]|eukprot:CEM35003.1 unnamed protein product [Vitrella brassicaformis CCMP3155]
MSDLPADVHSFVQKHQRDLNCLTDPDRSLRKAALARLDALFPPSTAATPTPTHTAGIKPLKHLFIHCLAPRIPHLLSDPVERCRETALTIMAKAVGLLDRQELTDLLPICLSALLSRIRPLPFPEEAEELRLDVLMLIGRLVRGVGEGCGGYCADLVDGLSKALTDANPEAKRESCGIVEAIAKTCQGDKLAKVGRPLVQSLARNLSHQHWKVRKATLEALGALLRQPDVCAAFMEDVLPTLATVRSDRTPAVRCCLSEVIADWLEHIGDEQRDRLEGRLAYLLLGGLADTELETVAAPSYAHLQAIAQKRQRQKRSQQEASATAKENHDNDQVMEPASPKAAPNEKESARGMLPLNVSAFPPPLSADRPPTDDMRAWVVGLLEKLLPQVLTDIITWTVPHRLTASRLLKLLIVLCDSHLTPYASPLLIHLYKTTSDDNPDVAHTVLECGHLLGRVIPLSLLLPLIGSHLGVEGGTHRERGEGAWLPEREVRGRVTATEVVDVDLQRLTNSKFTAVSVENKKSVMVVLGTLLEAQPTSLGERELWLAARYVEEQSREGGVDEVLRVLPRVVGALVRAAGEACRREGDRLFAVMLRLKACPSCDEDQVDQVIASLAAASGVPISALYTTHLEACLTGIPDHDAAPTPAASDMTGGQGFLADSASTVWQDDDARRSMLDTLVRNAGEGAAPCVRRLVPILVCQSDPNCACPMVRVDVLGLVYWMLTVDIPAIKETLRSDEVSVMLLRLVLLPNSIWRPGQANAKIRKAALLCIQALFPPVQPTATSPAPTPLLSSAELSSVLPDLMPPLTSSMSDDWAPDNRMVACKVVESLLVYLKGERGVDSMLYEKLYPELLKRLDDAQDDIRLAACSALTALMNALPANWSPTLVEYILQTLFIHLDDPNAAIQDAVADVLKAAMKHNTEAFLKEVRAAAPKSAHPRRCEELLRSAETLRLEAMQMQDSPEQ